MKPETAERILRRVRQRAFDYPPTKADKVARVIEKLKRVKLSVLHHSPDYHPFYACE